VKIGKAKTNQLETYALFNGSQRLRASVVTPGYEKGAASATPLLFLSDNHYIIIYIALARLITNGEKCLSTIIYLSSTKCSTVVASPDLMFSRYIPAARLLLSVRFAFISPCCIVVVV